MITASVNLSQWPGVNGVNTDVFVAWNRRRTKITMKKKKKQKSRLRIKGEGFDSRLGWMMGGVVGMELAWKKGIGLAAKTQGNSRLNRVLTKLPVHKSIPFRGTSSLPGGGEGDGISAPFSSRRFQFAVRLGTRTPEGPLFLIGDFQKLHPQPSSLRGQ